MNVAESFNNASSPLFSFEILPPLKGNSIYKVFRIVDTLREFNPSHINITSHHSEYVLREQPDGSLKRVSLRRRPGTVAIAAMIQHRYGITTVPHIICRGFTKEETEYALIDLNFLGITNLLLLRGDIKSEIVGDDRPGLYHEHATGLQEQVNKFNAGFSLDDTPLEGIETPFSYGMACYPEKHEEAPNMDSDIRYMKRKMELGAKYFVTQMFFDNSKFFDFVERCRREGITVPIIPGIKPLARISHLRMLPRTFRCDIPEELASEIRRCKTDDEVRGLGIEWAVTQCRDLMAHGVKGIHFYTMSAAANVREICIRIY